MPTRALHMRKVRELIRLKYEARSSHQEIEGALTISKGVVAKYVGRIAPAPRPASYGGRIKPNFAHLHAELNCSNMTLMLLWQEYCATNAGGLTYRYSQFADLYRQYVATLRRSMRQVHRAGEKLFVDYAGQSVGYGRDGDRAQIFVATLGASNYTFACATAHQRLVDWTGALVRALEYIDGVPALIVPDNAKALITDPDRYEPRASATIQDLSRHYGTAILPARPYRPQDKANVEVGVQIVQRWFLARLRDNKFATFAAVDDAVGDLLADLNTRPFKRLPGSRESAYQQLDRPTLKALPLGRHEFVRYHEARVNIDYHIAIDEHFYSVPQALVHQKVEARVTPPAASRSCTAANVLPRTYAPMSGSGIPTSPCIE